MTDLLGNTTLLVEAIDRAHPDKPFTEADLWAIAATLEWALGLNEQGRLALARELGGLRARQGARPGGTAAPTTGMDTDPLGSPEKVARAETMAHDLYINWCIGADEPLNWHGLAEAQRKGWTRAAVFALAYARHGDGS